MVSYTYSTNNNDGTLGRMVSVQSTEGTLAQYTYSGGMITHATNPQVTNGLILDITPDQFGRAAQMG